MIRSGVSDDPEYRLSTHERCSDPCPSFRTRIEDDPQFAFVGFWGPYVETAEGSRVAEGHRAVERFLVEHWLSSED